MLEASIFLGWFFLGRKLRDIRSGQIDGHEGKTTVLRPTLDSQYLQDLHDRRFFWFPIFFAKWDFKGDPDILC